MKIYIYLYYPVVTGGLKKTPAPVLKKNTGTGTSSTNQTPAPANQSFFLKFDHRHRHIIDNNIDPF